MKKIILLISLIGLYIPSHAQIVGMTKGEIDSLRKHIDTNNTAPLTYKKVFQSFLTTAQKALNEAPNPIEKIQSQGLLEGNPAKTASLKAVEDGYKVYALALVYRLYGDKTYLDKTITFLLAWARTNKPTGDPINGTKLEEMITGYDLVRDEISSENRKTIDDWMDSFADAQLNSESSKPGKGTTFNNWNSHRIKIITLIAYTLHAKKYDDLIVTELEKQLAMNLNADGTTHDFVERDAFHYHTYDLEPLLTTCIAIYRATGKNYFDYRTAKGASIKKCVDFMVPYMVGEKTHGEFMNSTVPFDQQRAKNHEKGYEAGTPFKPESGIYTLSLAAYFDKNCLVTIDKTMKSSPHYFNWQLALNSVKRK